jgi:hypothetical protein
MCSCAEGEALCGDACVDVVSNQEHCGACDVACLAEQSCIDSECICEDGLLACVDGCVDVLTDTDNCGDCEIVCGEGVPCVDGECQPTEPCSPAEDVTGSIPSVPVDGGCFRTQDDLTMFNKLGCWNFEGMTLFINDVETACSGDTVPDLVAPPPFGEGWYYFEITGQSEFPSNLGWWRE